MLEFTVIFVIQHQNNIEYISFVMTNDRYPEPDDSIVICEFMRSIEPYKFLDICAVVDSDGEVVWEDIEND